MERSALDFFDRHLFGVPNGYAMGYPPISEKAVGKSKTEVGSANGPVLRKSADLDSLKHAGGIGK